jgi:hypothetical protein
VPLGRRRRIAILLVVAALLAAAAVVAWIQSRRRSVGRALAEATHMVNAIRVAEEVYHAETQTYASPSAGLGLGQLYPAATPGAFWTGWGSTSTPLGKAWATLPVHADGAVCFGYAAIAGQAGQRPTAVVTMDGVPVSWPVPKDDWYIVIAMGDIRGTGVFTTVLGTSWDNDLRIDGPRE